MIGLSKRVTMQDVADLVGVSKVTVSKALRDSKDISESMLEKIKAAALQLGYVYNVTGKMLRNNLTYSIGIITSENYFGVDDFFYVDLYKSISNYLEEIHYTSMFYILDAANGKNLTIPSMLAEKKVDGVIILGQLSKDYVCKITALNMPIVFLDFYFDRFDIDSVNTDNFFSAYELTNMLIDEGHRKIAFVGNLNLTSSIQDRFLGYYKALLEYRIPLRKDWIISDRTDESEWIEIALPKDMPTAFVCNCDKTAQKLIKELQKKGTRVPLDCSVTGFDDSIHAVQVIPHISTVRVDIDEMARMTVKIISEKINGEQTNYGRVLVKGSIVQRESVSNIFVND
jgi:LacI family transcriptional regulator